MRTNKLSPMLLFLLLPGMTQSLRGQEVLTLEQCRTMALQDNKQILGSKQQVEAAHETRKAAFTRYLPDVRLSAAYERTFKDINLLPGDLFLPIVPYTAIDPKTGQFNKAALADPKTAVNTLVINPATGKPVVDAAGNPVFKQYAMVPGDKFNLTNHDFYLIRLSAVQPIFTGFKITEANRMASVAEHIAADRVTLSKAEILSKTDEAYWRVVSLRDKVKLAESYRSLLDTLVRDLGHIYEEGIITKNDLLKARVKQNEAKLKEFKARNGLDLSLMALAQIIGYKGSGLMVADTSVRETTQHVRPTQQDTESVADNRVEISMLKDKVSLAQSAERMARSRFMPDIALTAGYNWMNPNPHAAFKKNFGGDWNIGVVFSMSLFHWGDKAYSLKASRSNVNASKLELDDAREKIMLQIQQCRYKYAESMKKAELTNLSKDQAEENLRYARNNFKEGMVKLTDLLEAQVQWEQACNESIDALIEVKTSALELDKATGDIYQYNEMK